MFSMAPHGLASSYCLASSLTTLSLAYSTHLYLPPCCSSDMPNMLPPQGLCTFCSLSFNSHSPESFISHAFIFFRSLIKCQLSASPFHHSLFSLPCLIFLHKTSLCDIPSPCLSGYWLSLLNKNVSIRLSFLSALFIPVPPASRTVPETQ